MHLLRSNKDECECVPLLLSHHNETYQNAALKTARGIWTRSAQTYEGTHRAATNRLTKDSRTATSVVPSLPHHVIVISSYVYKINSVSRAVVNYLFILMSVLHIHYSWGAFGLSSWSDADRGKRLGRWEWRLDCALKDTTDQLGRGGIIPFI